MTNPVVSIIVPTCNRPKALTVCLNALCKQISSGAAVEVLVLDDGISDATRNLVQSEFLWTDWHRGPRRGPAANRNLGAKLARGNWLAFLDDDCIPCAGYLDAYLSAMNLVEGQRMVLEGPTIRSADPPSLLWQAPHNPKGGALISANFAMERKLFLETGGFDERYPHAYFEDTEFAARIRLLAVGEMFVPQAAIEHPLRKLASSFRLGKKWEARVISSMDHGASALHLLWHLPKHIALVIVSRFRDASLSYSNLKAALLFTAEFICALVLLPQWLIKHSRGPRSKFWNQHLAEQGGHRRYGL